MNFLSNWPREAKRENIVKQKLPLEHWRQDNKMISFRLVQEKQRLDV